MRVHNGSHGNPVPARRLAVALSVAAGSLVALAEPYISLSTQQDWQDALADSRITPVSTPYPALAAHYGTLGSDFIMVTPDLMALNNGQSAGLGDGLLMNWGDGTAPGSIPQVATWQYTYPMDPNLVGQVLSITVTPPAWPPPPQVAPPPPPPPPAAPILSVSLTLNDAAGGWVSWAWPVGGAGGLVPGVATTITIDPVALVSSPWVAPVKAGFNPLIAASIQADELAAGANLWAVFPAVPLVGGAKPWNYWGNLQVSPEPAHTGLAIGLLFVVAAVIRSRRWA